MIDWKTEGGRKAVAVAFPLKGSGSAVLVRSFDEKLLPAEASSASGCCICAVMRWKREAEYSAQHASP